MLGTPAGRVRYFHGGPHDPEQRLDLMAGERELEDLAETLGARLAAAPALRSPPVPHAPAGEDA